MNAYGDANTSLKAVALVVLESPTLAVATCYDPSLTKNVITAIAEKLQLNPQMDADDTSTIRIPLPRISLQVRQETATLLGKRAEACRKKIRNVRSKVLKLVKQGVAGKLEGISKDDAFRVQSEIESKTETVMATLNEIADKKHEAIMSIS